MSNKDDKSNMNEYSTIVKKYNIGYDNELILYKIVLIIHIWTFKTKN